MDSFSRGKIEIPYAIRAGTIVHVSEVVSGLDCCCICARCGGTLVARKGFQREHHFAHFRASECPGAAETLLHRLAKELLSNAKALALPSYVYRVRLKTRFGVPVTIEREILAASRMCISSVAVEDPLGPIVPDLLLRSGEKALIVEIAVSHRVDRAKLRRIRRINIPALELSLKPEDVVLSRVKLLERLVEETSIKSWLFHPDQRAAIGAWFKSRHRVVGHTLTRALNSCVDPAAKRLQPRRGGFSDWRRENEWAEEFFRKHGWYPTVADIHERNRRRG